MGPCAENFLLPHGHGLGRHCGVYGGFRGEHILSGKRDGEVGYACLLLGRDRHAAPYPYDHHGEHMGKTGLGNLVDMGSAADDHVYSLGSLRCLPGFALRRRRARKKSQVLGHIRHNSVRGSPRGLCLGPYKKRHIARGLRTWRRGNRPPP